MNDFFAHGGKKEQAAYKEMMLKKNTLFNEERCKNHS
jgi:hypothetical protein